MSAYRSRILERLRVEGRPEIDPRHVEGYMRLDHATLDGIGAEEFADEVRIAITCIDEGGARQAEVLARSFGLEKAS
jgi:hypothetical protein